MLFKLRTAENNIVEKPDNLSLFQLKCNAVIWIENIILPTAKPTTLLPKSKGLVACCGWLLSFS